jgi:hypothetical protein
MLTHCSLIRFLEKFRNTRFFGMLFTLPLWFRVGQLLLWISFVVWCNNGQHFSHHCLPLVIAKHLANLLIYPFLQIPYFIYLHRPYINFANTASLNKTRMSLLDYVSKITWILKLILYQFVILPLVQPVVLCDNAVQHLVSELLWSKSELQTTEK